MSRETRDECSIFISRHIRAEKMREIGADLHFFLHGHGYSSAERRRMALHLPQRGPHEQLEAYHRRYRIAREAEPRDIFEHSEGQRRTGPHLHLPELLLASQLREDAAGVVEIADRDARRCENEITVARALEFSLQRRLSIGRDSEVNRHAAG